MSPYQQFIAALSDEEVARLVHGDASIGCDDKGYCLVRGGISPLTGESPPEQARDQLKAMEPRLLEQLYSQRPLCRAEFDYQAAQWLLTEGASKFCRHQGQLNHWALMIDDHGLIAIGPDDVRSQYGYFCETDKALDKEQVESLVMTWLKSGDAYDDYLSKTVCRYCR